MNLFKILCRKKVILTTILPIILLVGVSNHAQSQQTKEDLQKKEAQLKKEINELSQSLVNLQKSKKASLSQIASIRRKIEAREELIRTITKRVRLLDEDIYQSSLEIYRMRKELDTLKQQYARSIAFAYKNRSNYQFLNFLFSATNFNDALKRVTYLKSYRRLRETQVSNIVKTQQVLQEKIGTLTTYKEEQSKVLETQKTQLQDLEEDKKQKDIVVNDIKGKEKEVTAMIRKKEKQRQQMKSTITAIIAREKAEAEKAARLAKQKAEAEAKKQAASGVATTTRTTSTTTSTSSSDEAISTMASSGNTTRTYNVLESSEEGLEMSINFEKRNLIWPVNIGTVIIPFGEYQVTDKLKGKSDGIEIAVPKGTSVKSVANGKVTYVGDYGGDQAVIIRHGKYLTVYSHLSSVNVTKDQEVKAGTVLGHSGVSEDGEESILFMVANDKGNFLNPRQWLKSR
ncbi:MAG: peptidoglycan DD-metalloendopeptidase family protein [Chitinophagaceae bacterium]|nr:peptidoglycan DD-metalloendopeptidase family protein [Chitinophagaceae bacterium]MCW5904059.1 peptidoglycan DD-metalloendopeptidase family protein [Chitinophagaceae bacterium]